MSIKFTLPIFFFTTRVVIEENQNLLLKYSINFIFCRRFNAFNFISIKSNLLTDVISNIFFCLIVLDDAFGKLKDEFDFTLIYKENALK